MVGNSLCNPTRKLAILYISTILFGLNSCNTEKTEIPVAFLGNSINSGIEVNIGSWKSTGPITIEKKLIGNKKSIDHNFLTVWNLSDSIPSELEFNFIAEDIQNNQNMQKKQRGKILRTDKDHVTLNKIPQKGYVSANYMACKIFSQRNQTVSLIAGSNLAMKIWLNDDLILQKYTESPLKDYKEIRAVHLKKGDNLVLIKGLTKPEFRFHFFLRIASISKMKEYYVENLRRNFIDNPVVEDTAILESSLDPSFFNEQTAPVFQIRTPHNRLVSAQEYSLKRNYKTLLSQLDMGVYKCRVSIGDETLEQPFVYGSPSDYISSAKVKIEKSDVDQKLNINLNALFTRYKVLDDYGRRNGFDRYLNRKIAHVCHSLAEIVANLENNKEPIVNVPGLHLRGYISKIDEQPQYYQLYIPEGCTEKNKIPLVIITPWAALTKRPFLESWHVADLNRTEMLVEQANKYGYAVLWPNSRIYNRFYEFPPIADSATFEVLEHVYNDYSIDKDRIYVYGACQGGGNALLLANRHPSYFAAVGVEGPDLFNGRLQTDQKIIHSALKYPQNFKNLPVYMMASDIDTKANFSYIKELTTKIRNYGGKVELDLLKGITRNREVDMFPDRRNIKRIFSFFENKKRVKAPNTLTYGTDKIKYGDAYWVHLTKKGSSQKATIKAALKPNNVIEFHTENIDGIDILLNRIKDIDENKNIVIKVNNRIYYADKYKDTLKVNLGEKQKSLAKNNALEGPINDVFSERFILLKEASKDTGNTAEIEETVNGFLAYWNNHFYGNCIVKKDTEITEKDRAESNLIILGNTSILANKVLQNLPLDINPRYIRVKDKEYFGNNLTLSIVSPNPLNPEKYLLYLFSSGFYDFEAMDLVYQGRYDYMIWDVNNRLVGTGNFDQLWE